MTYVATQTYLPNQAYENNKNGGLPVPALQLDLSIAVVLYNKEVRIKTASNTDQIVELVASNEYSGSLVIKGYDNSIRRGANGHFPESAPAGLYVETGQQSVASKFALPLSVIRQAVQLGGYIYVFLNGTAAHTMPTGAVYYKNGLLQASATATVASTTDVWAVFVPAAAAPNAP